MARNVTIESMDLGWDQIMGDLMDLDKSHVEVGIFEESGSYAKSKQPVAYIAALNEFGAEQTITKKQAHFLAGHVMEIDKEAEPGRYWGTVKKLTGKKLVMPERPFLRTTYLRFGDEFAEKVGALIGMVAEAKLGLDQAMQMIGAIQASRVKSVINDWETPQNAAMTVERKGKNDPLVDSRTMRDAVKFKKIVGGAASAPMVP